MSSNEDSNQKPPSPPPHFPLSSNVMAGPDLLPSSGGPMLPFNSVLPIREPIKVAVEDDSSRLQRLIRQLQWKEQQVRRMIGAGTYDNFCRHRVIDVLKPMESAVARWPDVPDAPAPPIPATLMQGGQHGCDASIASKSPKTSLYQSAGLQDHQLPPTNSSTREAPLNTTPANPVGGQGTVSATNGHRLQDYAMQLMLLERQNRRRLEMSKMEWERRKEQVSNSTEGNETAKEDKEEKCQESQTGSQPNQGPSTNPSNGLYFDRQRPESRIPEPKPLPMVMSCPQEWNPSQEQQRQPALLMQQQQLRQAQGQVLNQQQQPDQQPTQQQLLQRQQLQVRLAQERTLQHQRQQTMQQLCSTVQRGEQQAQLIAAQQCAQQQMQMRMQQQQQQWRQQHQHQQQWQQQQQQRMNGEVHKVPGHIQKGEPAPMSARLMQQCHTHLQQPSGSSEPLKRPNQNIELLVDRAKRLRLGRRRQSQMMAFESPCRCPSDVGRYSEATYAPRESFSIAQNLDHGAISEASWVVALDAFEAATISLQTVLRKDSPDAVISAMDMTHLRLLMLLCQMMARALNKNDLPVRVLTTMRCLPTSLRFGCDNMITGETLHSRLVANPLHDTLPASELATLKSNRSALDASPSVLEWALQNLHQSFNSLLHATSGPEYYSLLGGVEAHLQSLRSVVDNFVAQSISCNKTIQTLLNTLEEQAPSSSGADRMRQRPESHGSIDVGSPVELTTGMTNVPASAVAETDEVTHIDTQAKTSTGSPRSSSYSYCESEEDDDYALVSPV